jgi:hypothetical protein
MGVFFLTGRKHQTISIAAAVDPTKIMMDLKSWSSIFGPSFPYNEIDARDGTSHIRNAPAMRLDHMGERRGQRGTSALFVPCGRSSEVMTAEDMICRNSCACVVSKMLKEPGPGPREMQIPGPRINLAIDSMSADGICCT